VTLWIENLSITLIEAQECIICATGTSNHMKQDAALVVGMHNILNVRYP
jgi:hypothetical protein